MSWAGGYTKYLTEQAQRKAFLETRRSLENRYRTQQENERQGKTNRGITDRTTENFYSVIVSVWRREILLHTVIS